MADEGPLNFCVNDFIASEIVRSVSEGFVVLDFKGRVLSINPAALAMLALRWEDIRDKTTEDLFLRHPHNEAFHDLLHKCIRDRQGGLREEVSFRRADGEVLDLSLTASLLREAGREAEGIVMTLRDVTEQKALDRARRRVLDHLSHELKTPLAVIGASLKRLGKGVERGVLERIERNLTRLQNIQTEVEDIIKRRELREQYPFHRWLEEILDLAETLLEGVPTCGDPLREAREKIESLFRLEISSEGKRRVRLGTCLEQVFKEARRNSAHRSLDLVLSVRIDPELSIEPAVLEKVLMAPLKNAIENTPDGGTVSVSLDISGDMARVEMRDTGVGVTEESQKQVFKGFYHARDTNYYSTRRPFDFGAGGKGLGLLQVRIFSDLYGFHIEWESSRCRFIPKESDLCPGDVSRCPHIRGREECAGSGGTVFRLLFP
ncbi:MAG: PAS domain S-box protein [Deltaproteobacteria bacterium]|nr:PAS domain S-box protein [Deltaproteobacteria bacterium]